MGERFDFNLSLGEDEHKGLIFENGQVMKTIDVTYLLNSQDAEIKKLKKENEQFKSVLKEIVHQLDTEFNPEDNYVNYAVTTVIDGKTFYKIKKMVF